MSDPARKHLFKNSPFFKFEKFAAALRGWPEPKQKFYHEAAVLHSESKGATYFNWVAAVKTWDRMKPDEWRKLPQLKKAMSKLAKTMTIQEVMDLRAEGLLPENACWCCGVPWVDKAGTWYVDCKCTHWSKAIGGAIMCQTCKRCLACCPCSKQKELEL